MDDDIFEGTLRRAARCAGVGDNDFGGVETPNQLLDNASLCQYLEVVLNNLFPREVWDDSPKDTARRVLNFWKEFAPDGDELDFVPTTFVASQGKPQVVVSNIEFASLCKHHLLPFYGVAHVGYLPHARQIGVSKIPRIVRYFSRRPQTQETLADQIAGWLKDTIDAMGVIVCVEARHTCMSCRGIGAHNAKMVVTVLKGIYLTSAATKDEFWQMVGERLQV